MLPTFRKHNYQTLNTIHISRSALTKNHQALQEFHPEAKVCPVLKSNAYGHGLTTVAPLFDELKCEYLTVDSLFEAYQLLKIGIKSKILILGYTNPENFSVKKLPFEFAVYDLEVAKALHQYQPGCNIHIFIDTGMSREGVTLSELPIFLKEIKKLTRLNVIGIASHFADADNPNNQNFTQMQIDHFEKALHLFEAADLKPKWRHISASGGCFKVKSPLFNMIRAGIAHYGIHPLEKNDPAYRAITLQPALEFSSTIVQIKQISKGDRVGYSGTYTAPKKMMIGLLPAGYYEGVDRRLSNAGYVKIGNRFCPILGRVSMNMTTIDLSQVKNVKVGDKVVIYSSTLKDKNSLAHSAETAHTIPYELMVHLAESVKREVIDN